MNDDRREDTRRLEDQDMTTRIQELEATQEKTLDVLLGPLDAWGVRRHKDGLVYKVETIGARLTNGFKVKLPAGLWALLVAITSGLFGIGITLLQNMDNLPSP